MKTPIIFLICRSFAVVAGIAGVVLLGASFFIHTGDSVAQIRISAIALMASAFFSILATIGSGTRPVYAFIFSLMAAVGFGFIFGYYLYFWSWFMNYWGYSVVILLIWIVLVYPFLHCSLYIWRNHLRKL